MEKCILESRLCDSVAGAEAELAIMFSHSLIELVFYLTVDIKSGANIPDLRGQLNLVSPGLYYLAFSNHHQNVGTSVEVNSTLCKSSANISWVHTVQ